MENKQMAISETHDFHPVVQEWLEDNGYECEHESRLSDLGRVDFLATHVVSGEKLVVECKVKSGDIYSGLRQVRGYQSCVSGSKGLLAIPESIATEKHFKKARELGVAILEVPFELECYDENSILPSHPAILEAARRSSFCDDLISHPQKVLDEVLAYHSSEGTSPIFDIMMLYMLTVRMTAPSLLPGKIKGAIDFYRERLNELAAINIDEHYDKIDDCLLARCAISIIQDTRASYVIPKYGGAL
jgi:hypothetical protein